MDIVKSICFEEFQNSDSKHTFNMEMCKTVTSHETLTIATFINTGINKELDECVGAYKKMELVQVRSCSSIRYGIR